MEVLIFSMISVAVIVAVLMTYDKIMFAREKEELKRKQEIERDTEIRERTDLAVVRISEDRSPEQNVVTLTYSDGSVSTHTQNRDNVSPLTKQNETVA